MHSRMSVISGVNIVEGETRNSAIGHYHGSLNPVISHIWQSNFHHDGPQFKIHFHSRALGAHKWQSHE